MGVDVVDRAINTGHGLLHAAFGTFTAGSNHVVAVRCGAVANNFGIDFCPTPECVLQLFNHHHAAAAGNHEAITVCVIGTGGFVWRIIILGGQGAHGIEQAALAPVFFFTAASKDHILFAQLNLLNSLADAMGTGGTGRRDGVVHPLDLERGSQTGGNRTAHGAGDAVRANALDTTLTQCIDGLHLVLGGGSAGTGNQAGTWAGDLLFGQAAVCNGLLHGQVGKSSSIPHEAQDLAVNQLFQVNVYRAGNLAAQACLGVGRIETDTGASGTQAFSDCGLVRANAGNNANTGNNCTTHTLYPLKRISGSKQAYTQAFGAINFTTINADCTIGNRQDQ